MLPKRKKLPHGVPTWAKDYPKFFITICCHPREENQLCYDDVFTLITESLQFRQRRGDLWTYLLLLMPDHLHAIISFSSNVDMEECISQWKRYVSTNSTVTWQRGFFDHRLRNDDAYLEKAHYIRMNPVRAGLIDTNEKWPYVWR